MDINKEIEQTIKDKIKNIDVDGMVYDHITQVVSGDIKSQLRTAVKENINAIISAEISEVLKQPVNTDDGWGKKESYGSFEDLFKSEFKKKMNSQYEVKREIEKQVKSKVASLMKQEFNVVTEKIVGELLK